MTRMQKEMQERISREQLDQAFDARFPEEMQTKLRNARVAVAGLGGLGSNIAVMLARSGIGELLLVDFDPSAWQTKSRSIAGDIVSDQSISDISLRMYKSHTG